MDVSQSWPTCVVVRNCRGEAGKHGLSVVGGGLDIQIADGSIRVLSGTSGSKKEFRFERLYEIGAESGNEEVDFMTTSPTAHTQRSH